MVISGTVRGVDHAARMRQAKKIAARAVDLPVSEVAKNLFRKPSLRKQLIEQADCMEEGSKFTDRFLSLFITVLVGRLSIAV